MAEQMSIFENSDDNISVTKMKFISKEFTSYEEVFKGYNELRVITYSYSLEFIEKIMATFDCGEVILGFDRLVNKDAAALIANQQFVINEICRHPKLQKRIIDGQFKFYVLRDFISHQKVYLLKANDGRVRTITGSANFSNPAWNGENIETFTVCDDFACYETFKKDYETLLNLSTDKISKNATPISEDGENAEKIPIFERIVKENTILIHDTQDDAEKNYAFNIDKLDAKWRKNLAAVQIKHDKNGATILNTTTVSKVLTGIKKDNSLKKERQYINPHFVLDFEKHTVTYNQKEFNLTPDPTAIKKDLLNVYKYMQGFDLFTKDTARLKTMYWKVLNYMFLSPFIAKLRYVGYQYGYEERFFPLYILIYGASDAGKTGFIKFVQRLMFDEKIPALTQKYFSTKYMPTIKENIKGCPILIDELTPARWKYAKEIVKTDSNLIDEKLINHPTFVLLSNDVNSVAAEISKRVIVINIDNRLNRTSAAYNGQKINKLIRSTSNAFYCEYLRRMFNGVELLIQEMQAHDDSETKENWIPDVFNLSATILSDIMQEYGTEFPKEFKKFTWFDYMGDTIISEKATEIIKNEFKYNVKAFTANKTKNQLEIDFSCYDNKEAQKKLSTLRDELPADIECSITRTKALLKLDAIQKHTGLTFKTKKGFLWLK